MDAINLKTLPANTDELAVWLIVMLTMLFGYRYIKEIMEFVLLKMYEFFIQRKF